MPFYDLRCTDCKHEANIRASMDDKVQKRIACPECGSFNMETVFKSAPAFVKSQGSGSPVDCPNFSACGGACPHSQH